MRAALVILMVMISSLYGDDSDSNTRLKVLHITFHKGCAKEFSSLAEHFSFDLDTWFVPDMPPLFLDGITRGNAIYNIGHDRAEGIWNLQKDRFAQYDLIVTSDTAPLARIFLQNEWSKPLIIWICNRFDYSDQASLDCLFPDEEYYALFQSAAYANHVRVVAYTPFEHFYTKSKGVDTGSLIIKPCALEIETLTTSAIPAQIEKKETFFLPDYHNEKYFMDLSAHLNTLEIPNYRGRYNGAADLPDFKGIIHIPYTWSSLALFENMNSGIPYFIPSENFFRKLAQQGNFFHPNLDALISKNLFYLSEWYCPDHQELFIYFDSWDDLKEKIRTTNYQAKRHLILSYASEHKKIMLTRWGKIFKSLKCDL